MAAQAHKVYKHPIHKNEIDFAETLHEIKEKHRKAISTDTFLDIGFAYLVGPEAVVVHGKDEKGLLMTLYDCSLKQFLERTSASGLRAERGKRGGSAFLTTRRYDCVQSMEVIKAVSFQLLCAIAAMNERMSHCSNNKTFKGFVHNDLHLENILLLYNGNIALCDFELVSHTPGDPTTTVKNTFSRLPPPSRQSPRGMYTDSADTWGFALIVINLLTGVDPLFDNDVITDDFGNGPLLMGHDDPSVPQNAKVLDWEENIGKYVEELLLQLDPTGERKREASQLLTLCSRCLVNRKGATPSLASDLLRMDMFNTYRDSPVLASEVIQRWVEQQKKLEKQQK
ncbi:Protein tyrosine kinase/Protein kinase domain containing protein, putative [Angomonas deanei]|uniref:Protein tyrosine kinase/Protein kinase domain containing protein, putative n=1 Tax=Angomonas deanei TaxID=59799 RepID=A0A7G2C9S8_9TRYP|nr:Protein tyrosine kinase/Protein kinase domain containing protein, putative [Angomonas deanei]